ncbi:TrmH family RNA methyltransferase [Mycoplasmopsis gallinacea]|uniref:tRNA/rRNA methyltransferase n=1 Tax=Mycoplasmopsis gallinacea TaxID=29556 RepID=A0A449A2S0_9BACT|nr:RNA methyltransferase [Mycoplasmopsis gallinacea]VEU58539.1 tRNA/rRNA methyltransferase [Mycoplasmopsis gallinacea]
MEITSKTNPKVKFIRKLQNKKFRQESSNFVIEGEHLIKEALDSNLIIEIFENIDSKEFLFDGSTKVTREIIESILPSKNPQNCFALCKFKPEQKLGQKVIVLNNLQDPGNVGTIIRLAKAFDFDSVIVENLDFYNDKVLRSSQGAFFSVNLIATKNANQTMNLLREKGYKIYHTLLDKNALPLNNVSFESEKLAIIFGNEGNGIDPSLVSQDDTKVYVPISFESLNVACCAAIVLNKVRNG